MIAAACMLLNFIVINDRLNLQDDDYFNENIEIQENDIMYKKHFEAVKKRTLSR